MSEIHVVKNLSPQVGLLLIAIWFALHLCWENSAEKLCFLPPAFRNGLGLVDEGKN